MFFIYAQSLAYAIIHLMLKQLHLKSAKDYLVNNAFP